MLSTSRPLKSNWSVRRDLSLSENKEAFYIRGSERSRNYNAHFAEGAVIALQRGSQPTQVQGKTRFAVSGDTWCQTWWKVQLCCHYGSAAIVLLLRDHQTHVDWGQAKLVTGSKGPAVEHKEDISWHMSVLSVFIFHEALCCGLFGSPCHGKSSSKDGTTWTARLGVWALNCVCLILVFIRT